MRSVAFSSGQIGWKMEDFHIAAVRLEPVTRFLLFVIGSIVLNKVDAVATAIEGRHHHLLQEGQIGLPLKGNLADAGR